MYRPLIHPLPSSSSVVHVSATPTSGRFDSVWLGDGDDEMMMMMMMMWAGKLDMELHSTYNPDDPSESPFDVQKRVAKDYTVMPPLPEVSSSMIMLLSLFSIVCWDRPFIRASPS
jgi:hypothetical protein